MAAFTRHDYPSGPQPLVVVAAAEASSTATSGDTLRSMSFTQSPLLYIITRIVAALLTRVGEERRCGPHPCRRSWSLASGVTSRLLGCRREVLEVTAESSKGKRERAATAFY